MTVNYGAMIELVMAKDPRGEELLYKALTKGLRYLAIRQVGIDDADECVNDTFIALLMKVREGALAEPSALLSYARTILQRIIWTKYSERKKNQSDMDFDVAALTVKDNAPGPDRVFEGNQRIEIMKQGLAQLKPSENEILVRFYLKGQDSEVICREMELTETQFRLLKSRSKQKLEDYTCRLLRKTQQTSKPAAYAAVC